MNTDNKDIKAITEYRRSNKRCRTCKFAHSDSNYHWRCLAKNKRYTGHLAESRLYGIFCKIYSPNKF